MGDWIRNNKDIVNILIPSAIVGLSAYMVTDKLAAMAGAFFALLFVLGRLEDVIDRMDKKISNEIDKAIWICALDHVGPEERVDWTRRMKLQYRQSGDKITVGSE